ncbi:MAG: methyltransferase domain-containing protein [Deltaproteobacteria bacterium]|nr:methyltransferase domain-containing protein [Deltaproteobacteria bacterium]
MLKHLHSFQDLFADERYILLKNHLYNYLVRKRAIKRALRDVQTRYVLEIGSGLSPIAEKGPGATIVYSDLSFEALRILKRNRVEGLPVAADGMELPFRDGTFGVAVCSEVLEHIDDDRRAIREMARVVQPGGVVIVTFPHRHFYFAWDDRFVHHFRRYEVEEMLQWLREAGLEPFNVEKVLGPLEKITTILVLFVYTALGWLWGGNRTERKLGSLPRWTTLCFKGANRLYAGLAAFDARLWPLCLATVVLVKAEKRR